MGLVQNSLIEDEASILSLLLTILESKLNPSKSMSVIRHSAFVLILRPQSFFCSQKL